MSAALIGRNKRLSVLINFDINNFYFSRLLRGVPLQEFAPATTWILNKIPIENLNRNSHGRRSKLLQRPIVLAFTFRFSLFTLHLIYFASALALAFFPM